MCIASLDAVPFRSSTVIASATDVVLELGPVTVERAQIEDLLGSFGRIALILVGTAVVIRLMHRVVDRVVANVRDDEAGPIDRFRRSRVASGAVDATEHRLDTQRRIKRAEALGSVGRSVVSVALWTLALLTSLSTVGIELGPYIAGLGIVGVALGFGAQDLVKDFISGVFMLLEDQYGVGDVVEVGGGTSGVVEGVSLRTTRLRSVDGTLWFVPNGEIRRLGNMSQDWARALLDVGVAYDTDIDHAQAVIEGVALGMANEPEFRQLFLDVPTVWGVQNLGADAIDIRLVVQTTPGDQWAITRELRRRLKVALDEEGIEIPFPQRTLWVRGDGALADTVPRDDD